MKPSMLTVPDAINRRSAQVYHVLQGLTTQVQSIIPSLQHTVRNGLTLNENLVRLNSNVTTAVAQVGTVIAEQSSQRNRMDELCNEVRSLQTLMADLKKECKQEAKNQTQLLQDIRLLLLQRHPTSSATSAPTSPALSRQQTFDHTSAPTSPALSGRPTSEPSRITQDLTLTQPIITAEATTAATTTVAGATSATIHATEGASVMPVEPMPGPKASNALSTLLRTPVSQKGTKGAAPCQAEAQAAVDLFHWAWENNRVNPRMTQRNKRALATSDACFSSMDSSSTQRRRTF